MHFLHYWLLNRQSWFGRGHFQRIGAIAIVERLLFVLAHGH